MSSFLDRLNLRPQERRLVVGALAVVFLVLNLWLVWPRFGEAGRVEQSLDKARTTLNRYHSELQRTNDYHARIVELEGQGTAVLAEEQANTLISTIQNEARRSGLNTDRITPTARSPRGRTNDFFEESSLTVGITPSEASAIINFLEAVGTNALVIRVKELDLTPDNTQTRLKGTMKLVASYQKNPAAAPRAPTATATNSPRRFASNLIPNAK